jgi:hypothetical protein
MQYIVALMMVLVLNKFTLGQIQNAKTEILIIGTIHTGNKHFNHNTLLKTLKKYNPDVVLWEQSIKHKRNVGLLTAYNLKIVKRVSIEQVALQKYSRYKREIKILPYDTLIVSRNKYIKEKMRMEDVFFDRLYNAKKSFSDSLDFANYANSRNNYYESISNLTLIEINKPNVFEKSRALYQLEQDYIIPLAKKYITDSSLVKKYEHESNFWLARNNYMVSQILKYTKQFAGKRIIVFAGLNHKYFLNDKLKNNEDVNKVLIELEAD